MGQILTDFTEKLSTMKVMEWLTFGLLAGTAALVVVTGIYAYLTRKMANIMNEQAKTMSEEAHRTASARLQEILWRVMQDYRSPEILLAVDSLRRFYLSCEREGRDLFEEYDLVRKKDWGNLTGDSMWAINSGYPREVAGTLHHQRRLVSTFYQFLAAVHELDPSRDKDYVIYTNWAESNLRIIPEIILPIERGLARIFKSDSPAVEISLQRLQDFYDGSKRFDEELRRHKTKKQ